MHPYLCKYEVNNDMSDLFIVIPRCEIFILVKGAISVCRMGIKVSRLAYGVPVGSDLEYADEVTLSRALQGRSLL